MTTGICEAYCHDGRGVRLIEGHDQYAHMYSTWFNDAGENYAGGFGEPWPESLNIIDQLRAMELGLA